MEIVLIDTSVWVNIFRGIETDATKYLKSNKEYIYSATCPTIIQEILQGIVNDKQYKVISERLNNLVKLTPANYNDAEEAANLYRGLRLKGVTIRKPNDCLIAVYAIKNNIRILHDDKDFTNIAAFGDLKTVKL